MDTTEDGAFQPPSVIREMIEYVMSVGGSPQRIATTPGLNGMTLLHRFALNGGSREDLEKIWVSLADPESAFLQGNLSNCTALHMAAEKGSALGVRVILDVACKRGGQSFVRKLLLKLDQRGETALHKASREHKPLQDNHLVIAEALLTTEMLDSQELLLAGESMAPLNCAAFRGHLDMCQLLLKHATRKMEVLGNLSPMGRRSPLVDAAHNPPVFLSLLEAAGESGDAAQRRLLETRDASGRTPLNHIEDRLVEGVRSKSKMDDELLNVLGRWRLAREPSTLETHT